MNMEIKHLSRSFLTFALRLPYPFALWPVLRYRRISKGELDCR